MAETKKEDNKDQEEEKSPYEELTSTQKCAILMMLLGEDEASEILKNLGPKEVQQLGKEMYNVQGLDQDTVNRVLDEFLAIIKTQTDLGMGSSNYIKNVMTKALGENKAQSVLGRITPTESDKPIEILDWMDARSVAELISDEHPQIMSLIISYLDPGVAADVLVLLPEDVQADIIHRIATLETVQPDALAELERVMQLKFKTNTSLRASSVGGIKAACTPDFYLFSNKGKGNFLLFYHGQLDGSRPSNNVPVTGKDLRFAVKTLTQGNCYPPNQIPSLGCNIKWISGKEPDWFI